MSEQPIVTEISLSKGTPFAFVTFGSSSQVRRIAKTVAIWSLGFLLVGGTSFVMGIIQDWEGIVGGLSGLVTFISILLLIGAFSIYKDLRNASDVTVTCGHCGHTESMLASEKFLRCRECNKLIWLPRSKEETSAVARCPVCNEVNTLPAGGTEPVQCPNCYTLLHVAPDGTARPTEAEGGCPRCGARVTASSWMCPQCLTVLREEVVPSAVRLTDKGFIHGIGPSGALAAAGCYLEQARTHLRQADLGTEGPKDDVLDDFWYLVVSSFCLFRAGKDPSATEKALQLFGHFDEVYASFLLRLYFLCRNASEIRHQQFLREMNNQIANAAFYRMRCEQGLQQRELIPPEPPVKVDRWLVHLPVKEESLGARHAAVAKGVLVDTILPGLGALSYATRERDRVLLKPDRLRHKALELLGISSDLEGEELKALYQRKVEEPLPLT